MPLNRAQFLWLATLFEGALVVIALALGQWLSIDPFESLKLDHVAAIIGLLGCLPLYGLFLASEHLAATRDIRELLIERLGGLLAACSLQELIYLGFLAGTTEEILFRGLLQPWLERDWGVFGGLIFSNLIFALLHWITPTYALLAGLSGLYLGLSLDIGGERNLLTPLLIHALYDLLAFIAVAEAYRARFKARSH